MHISLFEKELGRRNFNHFLETILPRVDPAFVLVTGDITDAKSESGFTSGQLEGEWQWYQDILKAKGILERKDYWFDLRGNHDAFDVPTEKHNYFPKYSAQKTSSYAHHFKEHSISILSIDESPSYGLPRPYNFFASMDRSQMDRLEQGIEESLKLGIRHRILLGHYPTVTLQSQRSTSARSFADLTSKVSAYLTGHLHKLLFGLGETIKRVQPNGLWDFEVADVKEHQAYRIGLMDRGRLSFHDFDFKNESLMICIASPSDSRYALTDTRSARVYVFSEHPVKEVSASLNGKSFVLENSAQPNLWTGIIDALDGNVVVTAIDSKGNRAQAVQPFSSKNLQPFGSFGEYLLGLNLRRLVIWSCLLALTLTNLFLFALLFFAQRWKAADHRWLCKLRERIYQEQFVLQRRSWHLKCLYHLYCFGENHSLCSAFVFLLMYSTVGPWILGPLAADKALGVVFLMGIWHGASWTIILDTWFYCLLHLGFLIVPALLLFIIYSTGHNLVIEPKSPRQDEAEDFEHAQLLFPWYHWKPVYVIVGLWYIFNLIRVSRILINYGIIAFITSPVYTWLTCWIGYQLVRLMNRSRRSQSLIPRKVQ